MKKKLFLLVLMVAIMICAFAISASAATPNTEGETYTLSDGTVLPLWDTDGNGLIWYISTNNADDGYAAYDYVSNNQKDKTVYPYMEYNTWTGGITGGTGYQISWFKVWDMVGEKATEVAYSRGEKVVLANLQGAKYNDTTLFNCFNSTFQNAKKLEAVWVDKGTIAFVTFTFNNCYELVYTNVSETSLITCGGQANFAECRKLASIVLPDTVRVIGNWQFQTTAITEFTIPAGVTSWGDTNFKQCYYLENVYGYEEMIKKLIANETLTSISSYTFVDCYELNMPFTNGIIPEGITHIGAYAFDDCKNGSGWESIKLPNTLTNIGQNSFQGCVGIKKLRLGASFTTWDSYEGFKNCSGLEEVYIPASMTSIHGNVFNTAAKNCVFYFTGTLAQIETIKANSNTNNTAFFNACNQAKTVEEFNAIETKSGRYIVYGYNNCDAFYNGVHEEKLSEGETDTNLCILTKCAHCDYANVYVGNETTHIFTYTYAYANGYNKQGTTTCACTNAGCQKSAENEPEVLTNLAPIFTFLGYSTNDVNTEFAIGFSVDKTALAYFEENANVTFEYGVIAAAGNNDPMNAVGIPTIMANVPETVSSFNLRIRGFNTDEDKATSISMGMFVNTTDADANTTSAYIQKEQGATLTAYTLAQYIIDNTSVEEVI